MSLTLEDLLQEEHHDVQEGTGSPGWIDYAEKYYQNKQPPTDPGGADPTLWQHVRRHVLHEQGKQFSIPVQWKIRMQTQERLVPSPPQLKKGQRIVTINRIPYFREKRIVNGKSRIYYTNEKGQVQFSSAQRINRANHQYLEWRTAHGQFRTSPYKR